MATFGATISVPIFSGENYDYWSIKMKTFFLSQDLWDVVQKGVTIPAEGVSDSTQSKQESTKDARALFILQQAVSESIFPRLMRANTSKGAWEILQSKFQGNAKLASNHDRAAYRGGITGMDPKIYEAAAKGNLELLEHDISHPLDGFLTVNKNTILHICISSILVEEKTHQASAAKFVKDVLDKCPSLLLKANADNDTPLHVAARYGHASIVKVLIEHQKSQHQDLESGVLVEATTEMIGKLNKERDTALHEAVRHNHIEVVKQLLMEVDPNFSFGANAADETPLYLAAERCFPDLVSEILKKLKSPAYDGPLGRTALHAAAFWDDEGMMTKNILERYGGDLCKQADQNGWTPLHMAAYIGSIKATKQLLQSDRKVAYMKDAVGRTALHISALRNRYHVTKVIISMCPDCCEVVDNEGCNALHLAVNNRWRGQDAAVIIQDNSFLQNLLNQKDNDGNTPLHHYCDSVGYDKRVLKSPRVDKMVFNKMNQNARQIITSKSIPIDDHDRKKLDIFKDHRKDKLYFNGRLLEVGYDEIEKKKSKQEEVEWKQKMEIKRKKKIEEEDKAAQAHLVVAALITTVAFAAGITMPGGFVGGDDHAHPGSAVLRKSAAFKAFIITNALSLVLSSSAIFIHLIIPLLPSEYLFKKRSSLLKMAFQILLFTMAPMVLAFVTGTYAVLAHSTIIIPTCIICLSFFPILVYIFRKLIKE